MSRTLSNNTLAALFEPETTSVFLKFVEIDHASWANPFRFVQNDEDIVFDGDTYLQFPFKIEPPHDSATDISPGTLTLDNIERTLLPSLKSAMTTGGITVRLFIVNYDEPDTIIDFWNFELQAGRYNSKTIECTLLYENIMNESFPCDEATPARNPGLFKESA